MKSRNLHFARRFRQFRYLSKQINGLVESGKFETLSAVKQRRFLNKLRSLYAKLRSAIPAFQLKKALAGAAILLGVGLANPATAQLFGPKEVNPFGFQQNTTGGFVFPALVDIDDDGDLDMFVRIYDYGAEDATLFFQENTGTPTEANFGANQPIKNPFGIQQITYLTYVDFADIDDDGDYDLFAGEYYNTDGGFYYFENTGTPEAPSFAPPQFNPFGLASSYGFSAPTLVDLDDDGDFDMLSAREYGILEYFENVGTPEAPQFTTAVNNPFGINPPADSYFNFPDFADLDGDGDFDMLFATYNDVSYLGQMVFVENLGTPEAPSFEDMVFDPFGITTEQYVAIPEFADIDDDGDADLFLGDDYYGSLAFYENISQQNAAPTGADAMVTTDMNVPHSFSTDDFPFMDSDGGMLEEIQIVDLPAKGSLTNGGNDMMANEIVTADNISGIAYTPVMDEFGDAYDSFSFKVSDGEDFSAEIYTMTINVDFVQGLNELPENVTLELSPNPVQGMLTVEGHFPESFKNLRLELINTLGLVIDYESFTIQNGHFEFKKDLSLLSAGMYYVRIESNDKWRTLKFVKE